MLDQNEAIKLTYLAKNYWCHAMDLFTSIVCDFWKWVRIRIMVFQHATSCFDHLHSRFIYSVAVTIHWSMNLFIQNKVFINFLLKKNLGISWDTSMKQGTLYTPLHFLSGRKVHPTETPRGRWDSMMISEQKDIKPKTRGCGSLSWKWCLWECPTNKRMECVFFQNSVKLMTKII